jgi:hypothetical protein
MVNYVLSDFAEKCKSSGIPFQCNVEIDQLDTDEMLFSSILSNALDNALNAQKVLPDSRKNIKVMLKNMDGKLLLSVKNTILKAPVFADGLPVATRKGHGYGTQSIRYVTERIDDNDNVIGRGGSLSLRGEEFLVFSSNEILLRAKVADLDASDLLSGDGVVLTAPNLEDGGKVRTVIAYFVYYRK